MFSAVVLLLLPVGVSEYVVACQEYTIDMTIHKLLPNAGDVLTLAALHFLK